MTILGGFNHAPLPTIQDVLTVGRTVEESAAVNTPIRESVQEFPPAINTGAFFAQTVRGPILPPYGTKDRDRQLRLMYRNEYNTLIQGTVSAIVKKFVTTPWVVKGDSKTLVYYADSQGRQRTMPAVEHYQLVFQNAQFGAGWEVFASRLLEDFFTQDFGGVMELIGPGEPIGPIAGPISGVAQLDAGRSYITGNPYYPIMYFSLISGSLHRMHVSRIARFVDSPSPDERYFGIGLCAMSRAVAVASRQAYMQRYIETRVDDKPAPGIMTFQGLTEKQRETAFAAYSRQQQNDDLSPFGKTLFLTSVNIDNPIKVETTPFAVTPEKFDWVAYNSLDVDAVALAFGIDRQELWELAGRGLGSGAQSQILAEKARGKMLGFLYQNCERLFNRRILPDEFEFEFERRDPSEQQVETAINLQLAQIVQTLSAVPGIIRPDEARSFLSDNSPAFKDVLATAAGTVDAGDATQEVELEDDNPIDVSQQAGGQAPQTAPQSTETKPIPQKKAMKFDPAQARDEGGQWTEGGGSGPAPGVTPALQQTIGKLTPEQRQQLLQSLGKQPITPPAVIDKPQPAKPVGAPKEPVKPVGAFSKLNDQQTIAHSDAISKQHVAKLSPEEVKSVAGYTSTDYQWMNKDLRAGKQPSARDAKYMAKLDSALSKNALEQDTTLYRGRRQLPADWKVGAVVTDKAYVSTSVSKQKADNGFAVGATPTLIQIKAPKGTKGMFTSATSSFSSEAEYLLPRNTQFKITGVTKKKGMTYVDMEIVQ